MDCKCRSYKHDRKLGCVVPNDGHFGDYCDVCVKKCNVQLQVKKYPIYKFIPCRHPYASRRITRRYEKVEVENFDEKTGELEKLYTRGRFVGMDKYCVRCAHHWVRYGVEEQEHEPVGTCMVLNEWHPDTCNCAIEYVWDSSYPDIERVHWFFAARGYCPLHRKIKGVAKHELVTLHNQWKNWIQGYAMENIPLLVVVEMQEGRRCKVLRQHIKYVWKYNGTDNNVTLQVAFIGKYEPFTLSRYHIKMLQEYANVKCKGMVKVVDKLSDYQIPFAPLPTDEKPHRVAVHPKPVVKRLRRKTNLNG